MLIVVSLYFPFPSTSRKNLHLLLHLEITVFSNSSTKPNFINIVANRDYICLYIVYDSLCLGGSSTRSNFVWQCWSPRYSVSVLSTCGGYRPSGLIVTNLHKLKQITIITAIIDLGNLNYFHLHNLYISV